MRITAEGWAFFRARVGGAEATAAVLEHDQRGCMKCASRLSLPQEADEEDLREARRAGRGLAGRLSRAPAKRGGEALAAAQRQARLAAVARLQRPLSPGEVRGLDLAVASSSGLPEGARIEEAAADASSLFAHAAAKREALLVYIEEAAGRRLPKHSPLRAAAEAAYARSESARLSASPRCSGAVDRVQEREAPAAQRQAGADPAIDELSNLELGALSLSRRARRAPDPSVELGQPTAEGAEALRSEARQYLSLRVRAKDEEVEEAGALLRTQLLGSERSPEPSSAPLGPPAPAALRSTPGEAARLQAALDVAGGVTRRQRAASGDLSARVEGWLGRPLAEGERNAARVIYEEAHPTYAAASEAARREGANIRTVASSDAYRSVELLARLRAEALRGRGLTSSEVEVVGAALEAERKRVEIEAAGAAGVDLLRKPEEGERLLGRRPTDLDILLWSRVEQPTPKDPEEALRAAARGCAGLPDRLPICGSGASIDLARTDELERRASDALGRRLTGGEVIRLAELFGEEEQTLRREVAAGTLREPDWAPYLRRQARAYCATHARQKPGRQRRGAVRWARAVLRRELLPAERAAVLAECPPPLPSPTLPRSDDPRSETLRAATVRAERRAKDRLRLAGDVGRRLAEEDEASGRLPFDGGALREALTARVVAEAERSRERGESLDVPAAVQAAEDAYRRRRAEVADPRSPAEELVRYAARAAVKVEEALGPGPGAGPHPVARLRASRAGALQSGLSCLEANLGRAPSDVEETLLRLWIELERARAAGLARSLAELEVVLQERLRVDPGGSTT